MAQKWLSPDEVANRLDVSRRTAIGLMHQMPHTVIGGKTRQRVRVAENDLDAWMMKKQSGGRGGRSRNYGLAQRVPRRGEM